MIGNNNSNTSQTFWLSIGNLITFGFSIISVAILSRYLSKEDYGAYRQVIYIYGTLLVIFSMGLPKAYGYFIPKVNENQIKDIINKISFILLIIGVFFSLLLYFGSGLFADLLKNEKLDTALKYFSLVPFFMLPTLGIENILSALKKSHIMTMYTILSRSFMLICTVLPVIVFDLGYLVAIQGFVIASFISFVVALLIKYNLVKGVVQVKSQVSYKKIYQFALPLFYVSIWAWIINSSDQFFISRYFGSIEFATFSNGFFEFPLVSMLVASTATVLLPVFSGEINKDGILSDEVKRVWDSALKKTILLIYPLLVFLFVYADAMVITLYGESYSDSSIYFKFRTFLSFFQIIAFMPLLLALGATKYCSKVFMFTAFAIITLEYLAVLVFNSPYAVAVVSVIVWLGMIFFMARYIAKAFKIRIVDLFPVKMQLILVAGCGLAMLIIKLLLSEFNINIYSEAIVAGVLYLLIVLFVVYRIIGFDFMSILKPILKRK
ncbi:oligosaccharide flippase family protein [Pseudopedobacter sp.]|uniref:oligosaccharide flippase family protein n=1 Tax=Pseudopedobacter sp. TaxID=1936787 RepID=UPI003342285E